MEGQITNSRLSPMGGKPDLPESSTANESTADPFAHLFQEKPGVNPDSLNHNRFRIETKLGQGGMGVVYGAVDLQNQKEIALKIIKGALSGTARRRFEREFQSLASLQHPNCLKVFDYGELPAGPFFTMELFPGKPITTLSGCNLTDVLDALLQLTNAIDYIHSHGIIHRDIKPSNVLVCPAARLDGSSHFDVRLMDFGLAKFYGVKTSLSAEAGFVGTVAYCAPEQINLDELDHRADLYCLGLVTYELLTGQYVYPAAKRAGVRSLIQAHLKEKARPISELNPEIPKPIAETVMKYLRKQPQRRPDSAGLLRSAIAAYLGIDECSIPSGVSIACARPILSVTGFVCRGKEREKIEDLLLHSLYPTKASNLKIPPSLMVVSGEPGIGKSSLVQEAERIARSHGCHVYDGRCFDGNLSPFQPFVEIIRQLIAELRLQERREASPQKIDDLTDTHGADNSSKSLADLLEIVSRYSGELLRIAPELRKYLPGEVYHQVDYGREADYIYRALSAFFIEISVIQPICISFEDLQWADKSSLDLLRHLSETLASSRRAGSEGKGVFPRLIVVASARTGHAQLETFLAQLREHHLVLDIQLVPLIESETRELMALRLNSQPEELSEGLVARVHELCGGNPFFVAETVREWYEKNSITRTNGWWVLSNESTDNSDLPDTVREVMRLRLKGLSPMVQQVVFASSVIGAVVDIDLLRAVLPELSESDVLDAIDILLPRRVFRETTNPGQIEFVHDLLREIPYADLAATRRMSLHRRIGNFLEERRAKGHFVPIPVLADHFRNAENRSKAFAYTIEAAQGSLDAYAFNNAISQLNLALKVLPDDADMATRQNLWQMFGTAYSCAGRLDDAITAFEKAKSYCQDCLARAAAEYGIGEAFLKKGEYASANSQFDAALKEVGYPRSRSRIGLFFEMWKTSIYFHVFPFPFLKFGRSLTFYKRVEIAFKAYHRLCQTSGTKSLFDYSYCSYRAASLAKYSGKPEYIAIAYSKLGVNYSMFSLGRYGSYLAYQAQKAAKSCERADAVVSVDAHIACVQYFRGCLNEVEDKLLGTSAQLDKSGDWFGLFSHHILRHLYGVRGDITAEISQAESEIEIGTISGDTETLSWGRYGKANALARAGRSDEGRELLEGAIKSLERRQSNTIGFAYGILGYLLLQNSDYKGARNALEQSRLQIYKSLFFCEFAGPTFPLLVESLLGPNWAELKIGPDRNTARKARSEARLARFFGWCYPNYRPHALRVSGRAAYALGKKNRAKYYLLKAIEAAEKLGARYELARALLDASLVNPEKSREYQEKAKQILEKLGAVVPLAEQIQ